MKLKIIETHILPPVLLVALALGKGVSSAAEHIAASNAMQYSIRLFRALLTGPWTSMLRS